MVNAMAHRQKIRSVRDMITPDKKDTAIRNADGRVSSYQSDMSAPLAVV